ncbi:M20/M25/M40 family metallo-hydrolase [Paenibacillus sp. UMB4589-SE434]|uniref:M20/M25/M40 family metallo-hydrolase n=1 Tax=Paenibacillus sp. UMB4589-SE434 TaxID=3046314 RepID=UPI0025519010|nr:M20/M25/M40 family metallo-hydrolase [Paenibacillus sp. UMB4589-SE434]MDK8182488.1 M20/M25/M40 family metallo-hydrolase [Paenibacillus sp. UMB4589-SE434]
MKLAPHLNRSRSEDQQIQRYPVQLLQQLISFNTSNPPGHEAACIDYIRTILENIGIPCCIIASDNERPNLIARIKGSGKAPPLMLYGHVDVVGVDNQTWTQDPFEGQLIDGFVWGRGALDMKGGVAMMIAAFMRAYVEGTYLAGDVILLVVSDEEAGGEYGAKYLVEQHPHLFDGVKYAIGEFGGFSLYVGNRKLYPIMIAEKQVCWLRATIRGDGGHGSLSGNGGTNSMAKLADMLLRLQRAKWPVHVTPAAAHMIHAMADALSWPTGTVLRQLLRPRLTNQVLQALGDKGRLFDPLLHNTVNATIVQGGEKINVMPSMIVVQLDGRLLPGFKPEQLISELHNIIGQDIELEVIKYDPGASLPDMGLFPLLSRLLKDADPAAHPVPMLLPGGTDGRFFAQLGIQTYGYLPMPLPAELQFTSLIHAADERVPARAIEFGTDVLYSLLQQYGHDESV